MEHGMPVPYCIPQRGELLVLWDTNDYRTELMDEILKSQTAQRIIDFVAPIYGNGYVALWMFQAIGKPLDAIASFVDSLRD